MPLKRLERLILQTWHQVDGPLGLIILAGTLLYAGSVTREYVSGQFTINTLIAQQHEANTNIANLTALVRQMQQDQHNVINKLSDVQQSAAEIKNSQQTNKQQITQETRQAVEDITSTIHEQAASEVVPTYKGK